MLDVKNLHYAHKKQVLFNGISFEVKPHEKVALLGFNGSGKSTLLALLNALIFAPKTPIVFDGIPLNKTTLKDKTTAFNVRKNSALLFQDPSVMLFNATVYDELAFTLKQFDIPHTPHTIKELAHTLNIASILDKAVYKLSGGERQKVAFACCVIHKPKLLLLDEPTAFLDAKSYNTLIEYLSKSPAACIISTHDLEFAKRVATRAIVLKDKHIAYDGAISHLSWDRYTS